MPLFDSVCSEVEQLIDQQIVATKEGGCSVKVDNIVHFLSLKLTRN